MLFEHSTAEPARTSSGWRWSSGNAEHPVPGALPAAVFARLTGWAIWDYPAGRDKPGAYCVHYGTREQALADLRFAVAECRAAGINPDQ